MTPQTEEMKSKRGYSFQRTPIKGPTA